MARLLRLSLAATLAFLLVSAPVMAATIEEMQRPYFNLIRAPQAQKVTKGEGVIVAVLDTGVDAGHPDLKGALLPGFHVNKQSVAAANSDPDGHGTAMSGIIAARGGGFNNVLGIAPKAKILPVAMDFDADNIPGTLTAAIRYAVDHGAKILNMSVARPSFDPLSRSEVEAVAYAQSKGAVLIVSGGNTKDLTGGNLLADLPGVVAVAATTATGGEYFGSEKRDYNAIAAPGKDIVTTGARNVHSTGFVQDSGTSPATAVVAGVAALIKSKYPNIDAANIINRLIKTATDKGASGRDPVYGYGIVDAYAAVTASVPSVSKNPLGVISLSSNDKKSAEAANKSGGGLSASSLVPALVVLAIIAGGVFTIMHAIRSRKHGTPPIAGSPGGEELAAGQVQPPNPPAIGTTFTPQPTPPQPQQPPAPSDPNNPNPPQQNQV